jgi:hypothetical protein
MQKPATVFLRLAVIIIVVGSWSVASHAAPTTLYTFNGDSTFDGFGFSVSGAGDVNGDGFADLIVGADGDDNNGSSSGSARVFSGKDGAVLHTFNGDDSNDQFGGSVAGAGDVNGDGFADLIAGADGDDNNGSSSGSARVVTVNGAYNWLGQSDDPSDPTNWRLLNTTASPDATPAGRDVINITDTGQDAINTGTLSLHGGGVNVLSGSFFNSFTLTPIGPVLAVVPATLDLLDGGTLNIKGGTFNNDNSDLLASTVNVDDGVLQLAGGAEGTVQIDTLNVGEDGTVEFMSNPTNLQSRIINDGTVTASVSTTLGGTTPGTHYSGNGDLIIDNDTVTLTVNSPAFINLAPVQLNGGTLVAPNGVLLDGFSFWEGHGTVAAAVAQAFGSTIAATGDLTLGDTNAPDGFFSDGRLLTNNHSVTINDANVIVLGSLTQLGDGVHGGTLMAGAPVTGATSGTALHLLVEEGKNLEGRGDIVGNIKNNGTVTGDGTALDERLVFENGWTVSGKGTFENTLILGTFSPGESPVITEGTNQAFGETSIVEIELGGTTPGSGGNNHDQINDLATILLADNPTLSILAFNDFVPTIGNEFEIMTWQTQLDGTFGDVLIDPFFTDNGIGFDLIFTNTGGTGNLTLVATSAVPEPGTAVLLGALGWIGLARRRAA